MVCVWVNVRRCCGKEEVKEENCYGCGRRKVLMRHNRVDRRFLDPPQEQCEGQGNSEGERKPDTEINSGV